jgi:hypothetical protein
VLCAHAEDLCALPLTKVMVDGADDPLRQTQYVYSSMCRNGPWAHCLVNSQERVCAVWRMNALQGRYGVSCRCHWHDALCVGQGHGNALLTCDSVIVVCEGQCRVTSFEWCMAFCYMCCDTLGAKRHVSIVWQVAFLCQGMDWASAWFGQTHEEGGDHVAYLARH